MGRRNPKGYVTDLKRSKKLRAIELKGGKCSMCGGIFPPCVYDFHHIIPQKRKITWGSQFLNWSWDKVEKEINKCILLCANCHRLLHHNERKGIKTMNEINKEFPGNPVITPVVIPETEPQKPAETVTFVQPEEDFAGTVQPM